jgi:hypothetical protein
VDISQFLILLLENLSRLDFAEKVDIQTEVFIVRGRAILQKSRFLQIFYNEQTGTTAFALIEKDRRLWGIDYDNLRGWHLHPVKNPETHLEITPKTIEEVIDDILQAWIKLP